MASVTSDHTSTESDDTSVLVEPDTIQRSQYRADTTRRNRTSTSDPDDSDESCLECCCAICLLGGSLLCIRQMSRKRRVQILWIWLIIVAAIMGLVCGFVFFGTYSHHVAPTDMRIIDRKVSPVFCDSVSLGSNVVFTSYRFDTPPGIKPNKYERYEERDTSYVYYEDNKVWSYYLLEGSSTSVASCADKPITLYVIKGFDNFNKWKSNNDCFDCTIDTRYITQPCTGDTRDNYMLTALDSDEYYFAYADGLNDLWLRVHFRVKRTLYDTAGATKKCHHNYDCDLDLDLHKNEVVVYHISSYFKNDDLSITIGCKSRLWFYLVLYCACPLFLGCLLSLIVYKCCNDPTNLRLIRAPRRAYPRYPNERTPLIWGHRHPAVIPRPPKYEDIVRGDDSAPPSYEQATS